MGTVHCMGDTFDVDAMVNRFRERATAVRSRGMPPLEGADRVSARVELVSGPRDKYFPLSESRAMARALPDGRLTVTSTLDHVDLRPSLSEAGDALAFNNFVRRTLRRARP